MHPAMIAQQRMTDRRLFGMGFDRANAYGRLGRYMEMLNRYGNGGYSRRDITAAKMRPGVDPLGKAERA